MLSGVVDCDGFRLEWLREGRGIPMLVLGASRFYPRRVRGGPGST